MNLRKLFELQRQLDAHIEKEHPRQEGEDRLAKKILALMVELGELANEARFFKYWSYNQKPRTEELGECPLCKGTGDLGTVWAENCIECGGTGKVVVKNPLLEEFVDCLHFILSIGLELDFAKFIKDIEPIKNKNITEQFIFIFTKVGTLLTYQGLANYIHIIQNFIGLGEMLGLTWEQIEQAYFQKNKINHQRQEEGY